MKRTFTYTDATSNKFWSIETDATGKSFTVTFGKIGTAGQSKEKSFPSVEACTKEVEKLIREKTGKGYIEQGASSDRGTGSQLIDSGSNPTAPGQTKSVDTATSAKTKPTKPTPALLPYDAHDTAQPRAFLRAIRSGNLDKIRAYIEAGATLRECIKENKNSYPFPFEGALEDPKPEVIRYLIDLCLNDPKKHGGLFYLSMVAQNEDIPDEERLAKVQLLLDNGYDCSRDEHILVDLPYYILPEDLVRKLYSLASRTRDTGDAIYEGLQYGGDIRCSWITTPWKPDPVARLMWMLDQGLQLHFTPTERNKHAREAFGTPLHFALTVCGENLPLIQKLIEKGSDLLAKNAKRLTPLELAQTGSVKVSQAVTYLLRRATEEAQAAAKVASPAAGGATTVDANVALLSMLCRADVGGRAYFEKLQEQFRKILSSGTSPNALDAEGLAPLHHLSEHKVLFWSKDLLPIFIEAGADVNIRDSKGRTPLHHVRHTYSGNYNYITSLISAGGDINARDHADRTPLIHSLVFAKADEAAPSTDTNPIDPADEDSGEINADVVEYLLHAKADPKLATPDGNTFLHHAAVTRYAHGDSGIDELVAAAVSLGADINAKNSAGQTPLHCVLTRPGRRSGFLGDKILNAYLENKADPNAQDADGNTALHLAPDARSVRKILEALPDLTLANKAGVTAFESLKSRGYYEPDEAKIATAKNSSSLRNTKKLVDSLLATPAAERILPPLTWTSHAIDLSAKPGDKLRIVSSALIANDIDDHLVYLGGNRIGLVGNIPEDLDVFDTVAGKVAWRVSGCESTPPPIYDAAAVYVARDSQGARSITAHNPDTGEQIWKCSLSTSYLQFGTHIVQSPSHIYHASSHAKKIYITAKKNGKLVARIPLANPIQRYAYRDLLPWGENNLLVFAWHGKTGVRLIDLYDTTAHIRTLCELGNQAPILHAVHGDHLYLLIEGSGDLHKIHLPDGAIVKTTPHAFKHPGQSCLNQMRSSDGKTLRYTIQDGPGDTCTIYHCTYDFTTDTLTQSDTSTEPNRLADFTRPSYGGSDRIAKRLELGNAIYMAQRGGIAHGEDNTILHRLQ